MNLNIVGKILKAILLSQDKIKYIFRDNNSGGGGSNGGGTGPGIIPRKQRLEFVDSIEDDSNPEIEECKIYRLTEFGENGFNKDDYAVKNNDYNDELDILELIPRAEDYLDLDSKLEALRINGMKNSMAMQSHFLPTHRSELSIWEIGRILIYINNKLNDYLNNNIDYNREHLETLILASLILIYGRDIDELCNARIYIRDNSSNISNVAYVKSGKYFVLKITSPEYKTSMTDKEKSEALRVDKKIKMNCPEIIKDAIDVLILNNNKSHNGARLFSGDSTIYKQFIKKIISEVAECAATDVGLRKHVFSRILRKSSDIADAIMLTNQRYGTPGSRLHYTTRSKEVLVEIYRNSFNECLSEIVDEFEIESTVGSKWEINKLREQFGYVGARNTPKQKTIKNLVAGSIIKVKALRNKSWIEFHNFYVTYCIIMLDFATTNRAVARKYFFESDMDTINKNILVWDKGAGDSLNSRIVYFPDICIEQLYKYSKHRDKVLKKVALSGDDGYYKLADKKNKSPISFFKSKLRIQVKENIGHFFFLDQNGKPYNIKPGFLKKELKGLFHLPINTNRQYIRFNLMNEKVNGEIIDAYLGHSSYGEEPYGRYSFLTLDEVISEVKPCIDNMFENDGWLALSGLKFYGE